MNRTVKVQGRTRYAVLTELRLWQNNVQTRHVSDVHVIVHMRLQHGPLRARRLRLTLVRNTTQAPWSHQCAKHASKAYLGPRTRGVNCSRYAPQHPPSTLPKMHANPETVETITVNERVSMQEVVRGCGSSGRKEDPMQRRFRQDPMQERVSSGPHAG